jgi:hypothetical protein
MHFIRVAGSNTVGNGRSQLLSVHPDLRSTLGPVIAQVKVAAAGSRSRELSDLQLLKVGVSSLQIERMNRDLSTHSRCLSNISITLDDRDFTQQMILQVKVELVYPPDKKNVEETGLL